MIKRMIIMLLLVGVLFGAVFGFEAFKAHMIKQFMAKQSSPVETVSTMTAAEQSWQPQLEAVGSLTAKEGTDIAPEVGGIVSRIHFHSGEDVKAGAPLVSLDAASDIAHLHALEATAQLAQSTYERDRLQYRAHAISRATLDADLANVKSTTAQVAEQRALVDKKSIRAPFSGRLGIRAVNLGQYLNPGAKIVSLQELNPIFVDFFIPQRSIAEIKLGQPVSVKVDTFPDRTFPGKITSIAPSVDTGTRNVAVRATLPNPQHLLLPGMFATTDIEIGRKVEHVTLPQTAISYNPYGDLVFLVEKEGKGPDGKPQLVAKQKFVTTGPTRGDQVAILKGVKVGDVVVTAGQIKLRTGSRVEINNSIQPPNEAVPKVKDE